MILFITVNSSETSSKVNLVTSKSEKSYIIQYHQSDPSR